MIPDAILNECLREKKKYACDSNKSDGQVVVKQRGKRMEYGRITQCLQKSPACVGAVIPSYACIPAAKPDAQAQCRLYPPSSPVTSMTSPAK